MNGALAKISQKDIVSLNPLDISEDISSAVIEKDYGQMIALIPMNLFVDSLLVIRELSQYS